MSHGNRIDQLIRIGVLDLIVGKLLLGDAVTVHLVAPNCGLLPPHKLTQLRLACWKNRSELRHVSDALGTITTHVVAHLEKTT